MRRIVPIILAACLLLAPTAGMLSEPHTADGAVTTLTVHTDQRGATISPTLFGLMFEDINHSGDGGIYGELLSNRNFLASIPSPNDWWMVHSGNAQGLMSLDGTHPVTGTALSISLQLAISRAGTHDRLGVANDGFFGLPILPATTYHVSFYAMSDARFAGPLTVSLQTMSGTVYVSHAVTGVNTKWHHYSLTLTTPARIQPSQNNRFVIEAAHPGTLWLNLVSMFPPTWNNRPNGMRLDLMQDLNALRPSFLRFPGGNFLEGQSIATRFEWKNTIGSLSQRPGHLDDAWGYYSSDGLGLLEYLEWCEDLHMIPVLAVYAGYSLDGEYIPAGPKLQPYVQDALEEIQYATGSIDTPWGARRAADGHPAPFVIPYVEIGNEDFFDRSGSYNGRFSQFYDAFKKAYPAIKLIATTTVSSRTPDVYDQHFYNTPQWFIDNADHYDSYKRADPKIFVGEFAAQDTSNDIGQGTATLANALGEAAFITGLERNSDVVIMASYAPLFQNLNEFKWAPDLISYDSLHSYGSPSYYVQKLLSLNHGDLVVPTTLTGSTSLNYVASKVRANGTVFLTVVNTATTAQTTRIALKGATSVAASGTITVLTSRGPSDENSLETPRKVAPVTQQVHTLGASFSYAFQPNSVTVIQLSTR